VLCTVGAFWIAIQPGDTGLSLLLLVLAVASFTATEVLEASPRLARRGAAGATSFWAGVLLLGGLGLFLDGHRGIGSDHVVDAVLLASALVWGTACWRWGSPLLAALSAGSLFAFLARLPLGRAWWLGAGAALAGVAARRLDDAGWAPSHRRAAAVLVLVGVAAAYVAVNVYSLDEHALEGLRQFAPSRSAPPRVLVVLAAIATAVLPLGIVAWGWVSRRTFLLDAGIVLLGLSLVTLRHYVHVAPLWVVLTTAGAGLIGLALAAERTLRRSPGGERAGFTANALFSDERWQRMLHAVPAVAAFAPAAPGAVAEAKDFAPDGGTFGGGGASEKF
jgi:hypothetical protein